LPCGIVIFSPHQQIELAVIQFFEPFIQFFEPFIQFFEPFIIYNLQKNSLYFHTDRTISSDLFLECYLPVK